MTNREILESAGIIKDGSQFTPEQYASIESLSEEEVEALISSKSKLGEDFLEANCPHNFVF